MDINGKLFEVAGEKAYVMRGIFDFFDEKNFTRLLAEYEEAKKHGAKFYVGLYTNDLMERAHTERKLKNVVTDQDRLNLVEAVDFVDGAFLIPELRKNGVRDALELKILRQKAKRYSWYKLLIQMPKNNHKRMNGGDITGGSYFNLKRECLYMPCRTITASGGSSNGSCHPLEDRKFTIEELKRLSGVPDDFILTGSYEKQWERLGRLVPSVMMFHIAKTIEKEILCKIK